MKPLQFQEKVRGLAPQAIRTLRKLMKSNDDAIALAAAKETMDRGFGKSASTDHDPFEETFEGVDIQNILGKE